MYLYIPVISSWRILDQVKHKEQKCTELLNQLPKLKNVNHFCSTRILKEENQDFEKYALFFDVCCERDMFLNNAWARVITRIIAGISLVILFPAVAPIGIGIAAEACVQACYIHYLSRQVQWHGLLLGSQKGVVLNFQYDNSSGSANSNYINSILESYQYKLNKVVPMAESQEG